MCKCVCLCVSCPCARAMGLQYKHTQTDRQRGKALAKCVLGVNEILGIPEHTHKHRRTHKERSGFSVSGWRVFFLLHLFPPLLTVVVVGCCCCWSENVSKDTKTSARWRRVSVLLSSTMRGPTNSRDRVQHFFSLFNTRAIVFLGALAVARGGID